MIDFKPIVCSVSSGYLYPTIQTARMFCLTLLTASVVFVCSVSTSADEVRLLADNTLKYQGGKIALAVGMETQYLQAEQEAKRNQSGIWRDEFSPPDTWRQYPDAALNPYLDLQCSVCAARKQSRRQ